MYNDFIEILKNWNPVAQFVFLFLTWFTILGGALLIVKMIGEFLTETLPILIRGYPPMMDSHEEKNEKSEEETD